MKEFDLDSYNRKFLHTLTVFSDNTYGYVKQISYNENESIVFHVSKVGLVVKEPLYFNFKSKIYNLGNTYYCLKRRIKKAWKVGLCDLTYEIYPYNNPICLDEINPLSSLVYNKEQSLLEEGPLSDKIYITKYDVFYLNKHIGIRKKNNFFVNEAIEQEMKDALMGLECKIST